MSEISEIVEGIRFLWENYILYPISNFSFADALDILVLTLLLYGVVLFFSERRAGKLAVGFLLVLGLYAVSGLVGMRSLHEVLSWCAPFAVILLAVIFQSELRDGLERLGDRPFGLFIHRRDYADTAKVIDEVVDAACMIAQTHKDGALIVIERSTPLGDFAARGRKLDAEVSSDLLRNIFVDKTPLHDGAVIIRKNRIAAACCELPLTTNEEVVHGVGSRHRAAVGITEVSDCVVVVVSEQRHVVSIANNGFLKRNYNQKPEDFQNEQRARNIQKTLRKDLTRLLHGDVRFSVGADEENDDIERKSIFPEIRFIWSLGPHGGHAAEKGKKNSAAREKGHGAKPAGNRYRVVDVKKNGESVSDSASPSDTEAEAETRE